VTRGIKTQKSLYEYENYREFLRDFYASAKAKNKKFSFRFLSKKAGFTSSSAFHKLIQGKSNLSSDGIARVTVALQLNHEEAKFFRSLVLFNQASTPSEGNRHAEELLRFREFRKIHPLMEYQYRYYAHWYYAVIRELVCHPQFCEDADWIASQIKPRISSQEAARALDELIKLELLKRDEGGRLVQSVAHITSGDEVAFTGIVKSHRECLTRASESIDLFPRERRDISSMTIGITHAEAAEIKEKIQEFRKEITRIVARGTAPIESVYMLNIQLFPTVPGESDGKSDGTSAEKVQTEIEEEAS
jgi:uncharacterized protein (TIGR02147 family)